MRNDGIIISGELEDMLETVDRHFPAEIRVRTSRYEAEEIISKPW
jgi:hypothetical protein